MIFKGGSGSVVTEGGETNLAAEEEVSHKQDLLKRITGSKDLLLSEIKRICLKKESKAGFS